METKRIELIEANSQFNIRHNLAYYNQQILFDREGKFIDSPITGEQLRKYYEDYKTNPEYLKANPDDTLSWDDISKTNQSTELIETESSLVQQQRLYQTLRSQVGMEPNAAISVSVLSEAPSYQRRLQELKDIENRIVSEYCTVCITLYIIF